MFPDNMQWAHQLEQLPPGPVGPHAVPVPIVHQHHQEQQQQQQQQHPQQEQIAVMDKELETLLITEGIMAQNVNRLSSNGFIKKKILKLMSEQDIIESGITPLGQRKLLWETVQSISTSTSTVTPSQPVAATNQPVTTDSTCRQLEDLFRSLPSALNSEPQQQQQPLNTAGEVATINPFYHLIPPK